MAWLVLVLLAGGVIAFAATFFWILHVQPKLRRHRDRDRHRQKFRRTPAAVPPDEGPGFTRAKSE